MSNDYHITEATPADYPAVSELHQRFDFALRDPAFISWKYDRNPDGRGSLFILKKNDGTVHGTLGFIPKHPINNEKCPLPWDLCDGLLDSEARGQGLFLRLHDFGTKAISEPVTAFPNELALKPTINCGYSRYSRVHLWRFPINAMAIIKYNLPKNRLIAKIAYQLYATFFLGRSDPTLVMKKVSEFRTDFIDKKALLKKSVSSDFLNWRFIQNPLKNYHCYEFIRVGKTIGYVIFTVEDNSIDIFDFVSNETEASCFRCLSDYCLNQNMYYISFPAIGINLWRYGFLRTKGNCRFMLTYRSNSDLKGIVKLRDTDW